MGYVLIVIINMVSPNPQISMQAFGDRISCEQAQRAIISSLTQGNALMSAKSEAYCVVQGVGL